MDNLEHKDKFMDKSKRELAEAIVNIAEKMKFGDIHLVIQDSKIIQINKTEKIRLDK